MELIVLDVLTPGTCVTPALATAIPVEQVGDTADTTAITADDTTNTADEF